MAISTITSKGQITIPKSVREQLKLKTGDRIEIMVIENDHAIFRPLAKKVDDVFGRLYKPGRRA